MRQTQDNYLCSINKMSKLSDFSEQYKTSISQQPNQLTPITCTLNQLNCHRTSPKILQYTSLTAVRFQYRNLCKVKQPAQYKSTKSANTQA